MLGVIVVLVVVGLPVAYLVRRFRHGDEAAPGGSDGAQLLGATEGDQAPR